MTAAMPRGLPATHARAELTHISTRFLTPAVFAGCAPSQEVRVDAGGGVAGRSIAKVAPRPAPSLNADTDPPCVSARRRTIARPRPAPPVERSRELSMR